MVLLVCQLTKLVAALLFMLVISRLVTLFKVRDRVTPFLVEPVLLLRLNRQVCQTPVTSGLLEFGRIKLLNKVKLVRDLVETLLSLVVRFFDDPLDKAQLHRAV